MSYELPIIIYLSPDCTNCHKWNEVQWCEDNVFEPCEECGRQPRKFVLADGEQWGA